MQNLTLSNDQRRAVQSDSLAIVVVAGAGSGKTEVLARRVERLLSESQSEAFKVLAVTYTVKAADELRMRLKKQLKNLWRRVDSDTVHGFCLSLLRQFGSRVGVPADPEILSRDEDRVDVLNNWLVQSGRAWPDDPLQTFRTIDLARARMTSAPLLTEWRSVLEEQGALDFPAMLEKATDLVRGPWVGGNLRRLYRHIAVDEAQNLTPAQYEFLTTLVGEPGGEHLGVILIGDQRQSVVEFAGADSGLIDRFARDYSAEMIELRTNYRSAEAIIEVGRRVAKDLGQPVTPQVADFPAKGLVQVRQFQNELEEAKHVCSWVIELLSIGLPTKAVALGESLSVKPEDIAVLGRAAANVRSVRKALESEGVKCAVASSPDDWVATRTAKAAVEIIAFRAAPQHSSVRRRLEEFADTRQDGWSDLDQLLSSSSDMDVSKLAGLSSESPAAFIEDLHGLSVHDADWEGDLQQIEDAWESFLAETRRAERTFSNFRHHVARCQRGETLKDGVRLLTIQKAQGKEFKAVCVVACNQGQLPDFRATKEPERLGELRIFYVAVTRPSRVLVLTRAEERVTRYGGHPTSPSEFLVYLDQPGSSTVFS